MCVQCVHDLSAMLATTYWNKVIYIYIYSAVSDLYIYIYTHICTYVCMYVCMYVNKIMYVLLQTLKIDHVQFFSMFHFQN